MLQSPLVGAVRVIMEDVDRGGWQEAFAAIREVERLAAGEATGH